MDFKNLTFERLLADAKELNIASNNSYIISYPEFIQFFESLDEIKKHHLIISSHFVYGWMPTIIKINNSKIEDSLTILNKAKTDIQLNCFELENLKSCINNSMVGTSKLLHFIAPQNYAIWDSRIYRYITGKKQQNNINNAQNYLDYLDKVKTIINHTNFHQLYKHVNNQFKDYSISAMRAVEIVMFETVKLNYKS